MLNNCFSIKYKLFLLIIVINIKVWWEVAKKGDNLFYIHENCSFNHMHRMFNYIPCDKCRSIYRIENIHKCNNENPEDNKFLTWEYLIRRKHFSMSSLVIITLVVTTFLAICFIFFILYKVKHNVFYTYVKISMISSIKILHIYIHNY